MARNNRVKVSKQRRDLEMLWPAGSGTSIIRVLVYQVHAALRSKSRLHTFELQQYHTWYHRLPVRTAVPLVTGCTYTTKGESSTACRPLQLCNTNTEYEHLVLERTNPTLTLAL